MKNFTNSILSIFYVIETRFSYIAFTIIVNMTCDILSGVSDSLSCVHNTHSSMRFANNLSGVGWPFIAISAKLAGGGEKE